MWESIQYVGSGITLIALIASVIGVAYRRSLDHRVKLIQSADSDRKAELVKATLTFFAVNTNNLSKEQSFNMAIAQIQDRSRRFTIISLATCFLAVAAVVTTIYAFVHEGSKTDSLTPPKPNASRESLESNTGKEQVKEAKKVEKGATRKNDGQSTQAHGEAISDYAGTFKSELNMVLKINADGSYVFTAPGAIGSLSSSGPLKAERDEEGKITRFTSSSLEAGQFIQVLTKDHVELHRMSFHREQ